MNEDELIEVQNLIDYKFKNQHLLEQAFVRSSYAAENGGADNEVLEFIGDKVLDLIVVQMLVDRYGYFSEDERGNGFFCEWDEGELTEAKKRLVQRKKLARRMDMLGFADYLIMGKSDIKNKVNHQESVKEDLFEAIIGAVALDCEWNMNRLKNVIELMLAPDDELDDGSNENYIGLVQDWCMKKEGVLPLYHVEPYSTSFYYAGALNSYIRRNYPLNGMKNWKYMSYFKFQSMDHCFLDFGMSEKEARMNVAELAYRFLEKHDMLFSIRDEIDYPSMECSINQLETLARRGFFSVPVYGFSQTYDKNGNPIWSCNCRIQEVGQVFSAKSSVKKQAKKSAAYKMLMHVLEKDK